MITRNIRLAQQFKSWREANEHGIQGITKLIDDGVLPTEQQYFAVLGDAVWELQKSGPANAEDWTLSANDR